MYFIYLIKSIIFFEYLYHSILMESGLSNEAGNAGFRVSRIVDIEWQQKKNHSIFKESNFSTVMKIKNLYLYLYYIKKVCISV